MKITLESTKHTVLVFDEHNELAITARIWIGTTEDGVPIQALITRVAVEVTHDQRAFERDLHATSAPAPAHPAFPHHMKL